MGLGWFGRTFLLWLVWITFAGGAAAEVFINEVDYDNEGLDQFEWIELAGPTGTSLDSYDLQLINQDGDVYRFLRLSHADFVFGDDTGTGWGFFVLGKLPPELGDADWTPSGWPDNEVQNGPADTFELRFHWGTPVHVLDYEGVNPFTQETEMTPLEDTNLELDQTLYKTGRGITALDFEFANTPGHSTPGGLNVGQVLDFPATTTLNASRPTERVRSAPTPFREGTVITFENAVSGATTLAVFDITGRRVCQLLDSWMPAGPNEVRWTGVDDDGERLPSGIYFYELRSPDRLRARGQTQIVR